MKILSKPTAIVFAGGFFAVSVFAQGLPPPEVKLEDGVSAIVEILFDDSAEATLEAKRDRIVDTLDEKLPFNYIIRRTLGTNWAKLSPAQQREFTRLVTDLVLRAYTRKLKKENKPQISFGAPIELSQLRVEIPATLSVRDKQVSMAYRMAKLKSGWEIYDIYVKGISLSQNYRAQFMEHFQTKNAAALIQLLREKLTTG